MAADHSRPSLQGRHVLLVHEDGFHRRYLAGVIEDFGGVVLGPVPTAAAGLMLLGGHPAPAAVSLGDAVEDAVAVAAAARVRGIAILLLGSPRSGGQPIIGDQRLAAPYSGFQVVDALSALLCARRTSSRSGPHRQGH